MALFKQKQASRSVAGTDVRAQDDTYFDRQYSRKRSNHWRPSIMDTHGGAVIFIGSLIGIWLMTALVLSMVMYLVNMAYGMFSSGATVYPTLGIAWHGSELWSVFYWSLKFPLSWGLALLVSAILGIKYQRYTLRNKALNSDEDINDHEGDASVLTIPELVAKYKAVPDAGAHTRSVDATAVVAHLPISNVGIKKQMLPVLEPSDGKPFVFDKTPKMLGVKEVDVNGVEHIKTSKQSVIDEKGAIIQLDKVGMTDKRFQKLHNPSKLIVNEKKHKTLAEFINDDWYTPVYETQKPTGIYLVDDSPVNVLIVAMTRGNKGQTMINPTIDIWSRQDIKSNIYFNDPKGELYTGFYATLKMRGFDIVVFNLLDSMFTDQYNPLAPAIMYVRKGYSDEPQKLLKNLADNFFPMPDGGEPIWTQGEQMLFNMLSLLLMDFYYEEEQEYLDLYGGKKDPALINADLDKLWGHVTLPNVYRMVSVLSTRKYSPHDMATGEPILDDDGNPIEDDKNMLEEVFDLTNKLPKSSIRTLFSGPYSNLMSMADSEKMRSSIYGMTLTEMAFFVEAPVVALTNASPKNSFDLISMSFPRRFAFRFNQTLIEELGWISQTVVFELYEDPEFTKKYEGKKFSHVTRIDALGWAEMRFEAVLPKPVTYIKITVKPRGDNGGMVYGTFYGMFVKGYKQTSDGSGFIVDPITKQYEIKDGTIYMGSLIKNPKKPDSKIFSADLQVQPQAFLANGHQVPVFKLTEASYQEKPLAVFSVTPPSALVYVKIILMIIHSLFNSNVENSYMTKDNGKPLLKTRYMLDEAGNLVYNGSGIDSLTTKLSIGLAQGQEYTLVFQTMQQITDIYGETADRIISSNTGLMAFLLSSDLDMLETLSKQAGTHFVGRTNSKNLTKHVGTAMDTIEDSVAYTMSTSEEPLFSVNRLLHMVNGEALMLSTTKRATNDGSNARQQPIFDTQDTSLPMDWALNRYGHNQRKFSMLTVPTQNSTVANDDAIPPFEDLIYKRAAQAALVPVIEKTYKEEHHMSDIKYASAPHPEQISREIMHRVNIQLRAAKSKQAHDKLVAANGGNEEIQDIDVDAEDLADGIDDIDTSDFGEWDDEGNFIDPTTGEQTTLAATQDEIDNAVNKTTGMALSVDKETHRAQLQNTTEDKDVTSAKQKNDIKMANNQAKTLDEGHYSVEQVHTGQFRAALAEGLNSVPGHYNSGSWEMKVTDDPQQGNRFYYGGTLVAVQQVITQAQRATLDTGDAEASQVSLGERKMTGRSWDIKPEMIEILSTPGPWNTFPAGVKKLMFQTFKGRKTIAEEKAEMTEM